MEGDRRAARDGGNAEKAGDQRAEARKRDAGADADIGRVQQGS